MKLHTCSPILFVDCLDRIQISSILTLQEHTEVKFISQTVCQAVLDSIIRANTSRENIISASQRYYDKGQKRINRLLITSREFKDDEEKSCWKSSVKCPGVVIAKKTED